MPAHCIHCLVSIRELDSHRTQVANGRWGYKFEIQVSTWPGFGRSPCTLLLTSVHPSTASTGREVLPTSRNLWVYTWKQSPSAACLRRNSLHSLMRQKVPHTFLRNHTLHRVFFFLQAHILDVMATFLKSWAQSSFLNSL